MTQFVIPYAPGYVKVIAGIPLTLIFLGGLWWGGRRLVASLHGKAPGSPVFFAIVILVGLGAGFFLLAMFTSKPTVISDGGITFGGGPPSYQSKTVSWSQVTRVDCYLLRNGSQITHLSISYDGQHSSIGNAAMPLEPVRDFIAAHLPPDMVHPCSRTSTN